MKIDKNSSDRLSVLRFPLIVGVVFIHAYDTNVALSSGIVGIESQSYLSDFIRNFISQGIARTAVPLFFLMSGYFFFLGFSWSIENYRNKIYSRFRTLLVPFLFWNIITLFLLALAQSIPATKVFFSGTNALISTFSAYDYVNAIIGLDHLPISYQFWFIRDLMVLVLLTPLIYLILKRVPKMFLVGIFLLWYSNYWPIYIPSAASLAFFYTGAYFAYSNFSLFVFDRFGPAILSSYLFFLFIDTISKAYDFNNYIHKTGIVLGVVSALYVSNLIIQTKSIKNALIWAGGCSFFIFAVHEPLLTVLKKIIYKTVSPNSDVMILFLYIAIPIVVISLSILLYLTMKRITPKILNIISGGR
jgi:surface polysaccharide O-acyltransferase-like enzyme